MASCVICKKEVSTYLYVRAKYADREGDHVFIGVRLREELLTLYRHGRTDYLPGLAGGTRDIERVRHRIEANPKLTADKKAELIKDIVERILPARLASGENHCRGHEPPEVAAALTKALKPTSGRPVRLLWSPGPAVEPLLKTRSPLPSRLPGVRAIEVGGVGELGGAIDALLEVAA